MAPSPRREVYVVPCSRFVGVADKFNSGGKLSKEQYLIILKNIFRLPSQGEEGETLSASV